MKIHWRNKKGNKTISKGSSKGQRLCERIIQGKKRIKKLKIL
jgi:hypothetical protein